MAAEGNLLACCLQALCAGAEDIPVVFTWRNHYNPWHFLQESLLPLFIALLNAGLESVRKIQVIEISEPWPGARMNRLVLKPCVAACTVPCLSRHIGMGQHLDVSWLTDSLHWDHLLTTSRASLSCSR